MTEAQSIRTFITTVTDTLDLNIISLQSQILWQLLALKEQAHVAEVMTHEMSKISHERKNSILSVLLDGVCQRNLPLEHKTLRNDIAVIVNTIADLCHEMVNKSFSSGFTDTIAHYLMSHELGGLSNIMKMAALKKDSNVVKPRFIYAKNFNGAGLLEFLLLYLERDSANEGVLVWTDKQLQGLQLQAISFLNSLVPRIPQKWSSANGNSALLEYLTDLLKRHQSKAAAQTQSMISIPTAAAAKRAASAAVNPPISRTVWTGLVGGTLRLLSRISELGPSQKRALGGQGAFDVLIAILTDSTQRSDIWRTAFLICSSLCQGCKSNKTLFGECGGVDMVLPFLTYSSADTKETEAVLLAAVECIWGSICGSSVNEATFFAADGIFALLDLVAKSSYILRRHILGCLLDLLENPKARSHVLEWRSSANEQTGVVHLLVSLWNSEETRLGEKVPSGFAGKLIDEKRPLYGKNQTIHEGHSKDGFVIEELSENLRAKIYSMFCKLGFERFSEKITAAEQVKLTLIAKFLDFKIGQVWEEISDELDYEGIRPVSPDLDCILTAKQVIMEKARAIIQKQDDIIEKAAQNERIEEAAFYSTYAKQRGIQTTGVSLLKRKMNQDIPTVSVITFTGPGRSHEDKTSNVLEAGPMVFMAAASSSASTDVDRLRPPSSSTFYSAVDTRAPSMSDQASDVMLARRLAPSLDIRDVTAAHPITWFPSHLETSAFAAFAFKIYLPVLPYVVVSALWSALVLVFWQLHIWSPTNSLFLATVLGTSLSLLLAFRLNTA
ncbi:hypothetical protein HDU83_002823 [Entophlyctis luteolus]|nr:hypothetical protein HDU83_002823 [Entophlyctis luteolus]